MAEVNISEAARLARKGRSTIQRHIREGKISVSRDGLGNPVIDTAELCRVYGAIQNGDASQHASTMQTDTATVALLREQLQAAAEREDWLKRQLEEEKERSRALELRLLPPMPKGFWARLFGR